MSAKTPPLLRSAITLGAIFLIEGVISWPIVHTLFGQRHALAFSLGVLTGVLNLFLLVVLGRILVFGEANVQKKGLIFLILFKYLIILSLMVGGLYIWRLPPISLILGILLVFPALGIAKLIPSREEK